MGTTLAAFDAVRLQELPLTRRGAQWALPLVHGGPEVQVVRIMPRAKVAAWLLERARRHALNATRVQGTEGVTAELQALRESLEKQAAEERSATRSPNGTPAWPLLWRAFRERGGPVRAEPTA